MLSIFRRSSRKKPSRERPVRSSAPAITGLFAQSGTRTAWWGLDAALGLVDSVPTEDPPKHGGVYLSFSPEEDFSRSFERSYSATVSELIADLGEDVFCFKQQAAKIAANDSKLIKALRQPRIYATYKSRIESTPANVQLISGIAALRGLLATSNKLDSVEAPFVTGILFDGHDTGVQVLILGVCQDDGEIDQFDYIPLAGLDPASAIRSYVQSVRLSASGEWTQDRTAIFPASALLVDGLQLTPYPKEASYFGVAESKLWKIGMITSISALTLVSTGSAALHFQNASKSLEIQSTKLEIQKTTDEITKAITGPYLSSVLEKRSVDYESAIDKAKRVWTPGATVAIKASKDLLLLTVTHKVQSVDQSPEILAKALSIAPPPGCERLPPETSQQITELYLSYECKTSDSDLQRLQSISR